MLSVLLVEDRPQQKHKLLSFLEAGKKTIFSRVDIAISQSDAIKYARERKYDLMIADLLIPRLLDTSASEENCIDLICEVEEGENCFAPSHILAITQSSELTSEVKAFFQGRPWGILIYREDDPSTLISIQRTCEFILRGSPDSRQQAGCDVAILTALMDPEFAALEELDFNWMPIEPLDSAQLFRRGSVTTLNGRTVRIVAAYAPRMGPIASAVLSVKVIQAFGPKLVLMAGICAGLENKASIGDVIFADCAWDWQSGKYSDRNGVEHFEIAPHQVHVEDSLRSKMQLFQREAGFWGSFSQVARELKVDAPRLVIGPIASGSAVLADERITKRIQEQQHRNLAGLEMEIYGVYAAVRSTSQDTSFGALKSVCDDGTKTKTDQFQRYASSNSAKAALHFLKSYGDSFLAPQES